MTIYKNHVIKSYCEEVFDLEDSDFNILYEFAKKGETYRNNIKLAFLSVRQVARRVDTLNEMGFLKLIKSTPYNGVKKRNRVFGLSFKGFLASLVKIDLEKNYLIRKFLGVLEHEFHKPVIEYLKIYILEFLVYHKELGIRLDKSKNLPTYVRSILYDHKLLEYSNKSKQILENINKDVVILDEIHDLISDMRNYERDYDPDEQGYEESESDKHEFLINFWPNILDGIGSGIDIEKELMGFSYDDTPFNIKQPKEDIFREHQQNLHLMSKQWMRRKLNFVTYAGSNIDSIMKKFKKVN